MTTAQRYLVLAVACLAVVVEISNSLLVAAQPAPVASRKTVSTAGKMQITVVNTDGEGLSRAEIFVAVWTDEPFDHNRDYKCNAAGEIEIQLPKTLTILRIWARYDGYVPLFAGWWPERQDNGFPIPEKFTFRLAKGSVIGGIVKNEDGLPIVGAKVEVMHEGRADEMKNRPIVDTWLAYSDAARTTDSEGRWSLNNVPPEEAAQVLLKISHPDYINDQSWGEMQQRQDVTMEALRAQTATIVMRRGINVSGTVTDADGKPVAGAVVIYGDRPYQQEGSQEVRSGDDGKYRFPPLPAFPITVTVVAEGWKPDLRRIDVTPENTQVDFQLQRGKTLRVRFVDDAGKPVPKVGVRIEGWRGGESLYNDKHPNVLDTKIPASADEHGIYEWSWAPDDAVAYRLFGNKDTPVPPVRVTLVANGADHIVTVPPLPLVVSGSVVDAETGEPIQRFTVRPVLESADDGLVVQRGGAVFDEGPYSLEIAHRGGAYRVRVEAEGYRSAMSQQAVRFGDTKTRCDLRLQPAAPANGRVLDAAGKPIANATVFLATATQPLNAMHYDKGGQTLRPGSDFRRTLADGSFSFPAQFERYALLAFDGVGYVERIYDPEQSPGDLVLEEGARVEGRLLDRDQPIAGAEVTLRPIRLSSAGMPRIDDRYVARTDGDGRFVFDRAPAVKCTIAADVSVGHDGPVASRESVPRDLQPGQEVTINFGQTGAVVTGRLVVSGAAARDIDLRNSVNYLLHKMRGIKPPLKVALERFDWRSWSDTFTNTPAGAAFLETLHHYLVKLNRDGAFRVSGVPEGDYELALNVDARPKGSSVKPVATKVVRFHVSAADVKRGSLDLPDIEIEAARGE